jgi:hypothetical protein
LGPHLIETMRLAGFPPCAKSPADLRVAEPARLPECMANREKQISRRLPAWLLKEFQLRVVTNRIGLSG